MDETEIAGRLASIEGRCKSNSHRLDTVEKNQEAIHQLATSVAVMATQMKATGDKLESLCDDVKGLKEEPGKKWQVVVKSVLSALAAAAIGFILGNLGIA
ncbi:MAG: hypothetical protein SOZ90_04160 [Candidatus Faecousia sp.]|nr:hypothetical protein [Candidatus Faecousia sp.]